MLTIAITHKLPDQSSKSLKEQIDLMAEGFVWMGTSIRGLSKTQMAGMPGDPLRDVALVEEVAAEGALAIVRYELSGEEKRLAAIRPGKPEIRNGLYCLRLVKEKNVVLPADSLRGINTKGRTILKLEGTEHDDVLVEAKARGLL